MHRFRFRWTFLLLLLVGLGLGGWRAAIALRQSTSPATEQVGEREDGTARLPSDAVVAPAGTVRRLPNTRPKDLALSPDGVLVAVLTQNSVVFFRRHDAETVATVPVEAAGPLGIAWSPDGKTVYASLNKGKIACVAANDAGKWVKEREIALGNIAPDTDAPDVASGTSGRGRVENDPQLTGLAVAPDGKTLYAGMGIRNAVAVVALPEGKATKTFRVGVAPYHLVLSPDGGTLAVSDRGGPMAGPKDPSALSAGTRVRVDPRTDAALSGGVTLIDTRSGQTHTLEAGRQPGGMVFTPNGTTLFVAASDDDTILQIDVAAHQVQRILLLHAPTESAFGQLPTALALGDWNPDSKRGTLYVACGGTNEIAILNTGTGIISERIPTGWFPLALARTTNGSLIVASSKGFGSRARRDNKGTTGAYGVADTVGTIQFLAPGTGSMGLGDRAMATAGPEQQTASPRPDVPPVPVPERIGEPSVFKHVVYIIKENHTYDTDLGDMPEGNGDKSLCLFTEGVTPNEHALARAFVLLDNTYASGTNSADGHQWQMSGIANAYMERNYAAHVRSYPYDGGDPLAYSSRGFLWNAAIAAGKSLRVYGEFVNHPHVVNHKTKKAGTWSQMWRDYKSTGLSNFDITPETDNAALRPYLHPHYIGFPTTVPDQWRADQFLADLSGWEKDDARGSAAMPNLCILLLPCDHTMGTRPGVPTPRACVADNDLALGRIVERLSQSRFWSDTLILVMEDDSQLGLDHVDGHRTVAFCLSPYTKRGAVVHELYNHDSFLATIEHILGLPPMTRFDALARPLTACFTNTPDVHSYKAKPNNVPLDELNPPVTALKSREAQHLAQASEKQDWSQLDRADPQVVARAVWSVQRPGKPFPAQRFSAVKDDDE